MWSWDLDDALIRDMATSWPQIRHLVLDPNDCWVSPSRITLQGLEPLVVHCPHLEVFGAVINATLQNFNNGSDGGARSVLPP